MAMFLLHLHSWGQDRQKGVWTSWSCRALLDTAGFLGVTWRRLALSRDGDWFHIAALVVFNSLLEAPIRTIGFVALCNPHSFRRVTVVVDSSLMFHFKDQTGFGAFIGIWS